MTDAERFFYEHAGYSYDPRTETPEEGRLRCARALAAAEDRLRAGPYFVSVDPDPVPWDGDTPWDGPLWIVTVYSVEGATDDLTVVGSLCNVACEVGNPYLRVVAAELADEYIKTETES